jgi:hypothetical protein
MKTALSFGLTLAVGALALTGTPQAAYAANTNIAGTECKNYNAGEEKFMDYLTDGIRNIDSVAHTIICPIVHTPGSATTVNVYVDGYSQTGYPIACVLYSYNYTGAFIASTSMPGKTGTFDTPVSVAGALWSTANLYCTLPPSGKGIIYDIDVYQ